MPTIFHETGGGSSAWDKLKNKPDLLNCMRMYGGLSLDPNATTTDTSAQYNTIALSTTTADTVAFSKVLTDLPKSRYSVMIRLKISANTDKNNILKIECGDTEGLKTYYIKPSMFTSADVFQSFGFTVDHNSNSFTVKLSVGTALDGVTVNIDYLAISPTFTAITSVA